MDLELFRELRWLLIIAVSVSLFFPINVPLAALAYKVQRGTKPLGIEPVPFWTRSTFAALGLTVLSWAILFVDQYLVDSFFPPDMIHLTLLLLFIPAGMAYFFWIFGFDEVPEAVSVFALYIGLPGMVLALLLFVNLRFPLAMAESFIRESARGVL